VHSSVDFDENRHCAVCTPQIAGGCNSGETGGRPKRDFTRNAGLLGGCGRIAYRHLKRRHFDAGECHRVAKEVVFADADLFSYRRPQRVQASRLGPAHHPSILVAWRVSWACSEGALRRSTRNSAMVGCHHPRAKSRSSAAQRAGQAWTSASWVGLRQVAHTRVAPTVETSG
jgi:hypothetical protein